MTDSPNGQLPDGAMERQGKEPGQVAHDKRYRKLPSFEEGRSWAEQPEWVKREYAEMEREVLAEHSTPALKALNAEIDRLRQLLARRDSQLAAAGVPCPEIPEGVLPPGVLQAYADASRNHSRRDEHFQAHAAGLRAALMHDRAQRVPRTSGEVEERRGKLLELAGRLQAWSENDSNPDYFFGGDGYVFSAMQMDCWDAAVAIRASVPAEMGRVRLVSETKVVLPGGRVFTVSPGNVEGMEKVELNLSPDTSVSVNGVPLHRAASSIRPGELLSIPAAASASRTAGEVAYATRFQGFTLGRRGVSDAWKDLPAGAQAVWEEVAQAVLLFHEPRRVALPAYSEAIVWAADRYLMSVAFRGDHILPAQFRWADCWRAMVGASPKPTPFRLDPRWSGMSLGFEGGTLNLKLPEGSAELVFVEDELEAIREEGRTIRICRLAPSEVFAIHHHLAAYVEARAQHPARTEA